MTEQVKDATEAKPTEVVEPKVEAQPETIAQIIGDPKEDKTEAKTVPEAAFLELKKDNKQLAKDVKDLRRQIAEGAPEGAISASLEDIAKEYDTDPKFLSKLAAAIRKDVETETEQRFSAKLKPFEDKDRAEQVQKAFSTHFEKAMNEMEDYKGIVNKDAIFALSLNPANASKTLPQLIEETYGGAVSGKRSIETTTPRSGASPGVLDIDRANSDPAYLDEVKKDPALKKQYDEKIMEIARRA